MSVTEIESAIAQLPAEDFVAIVKWLSYREQVWDKQIERDLEAGHLDTLLAEVDREHQSGLARPL
jgi:hypothetical protein